MHSVLGFILGGGRGTGLFPLTRHRSAPAVPLAGKYRLIDIPISNCINSDVDRVYILTQFLSVSLHRHVTTTYKFAPFRTGFIDLLPAQQTNTTADWYQGTADALRQNLRYFAHDHSRDVLILSGDGLYRMNYRDLVRHHRETNADVTIAVVPVAESSASHFGVIRTEGGDRVAQLVEKPDASKLAALRVAGLGGGREYLANTGIYLVKRTFLLEMLQRDPAAVDLVTQHFATVTATKNVRAFTYTGYWQDIGRSVRAYHDAHLALAGPTPPFDFHSSGGVIYTRMRNLPASRIRANALDRCIVSDGCLVERGANLRDCVVGQRAQVGAGSTLVETVVNGADRFESAAERRESAARGIPPIGIGEGCEIRRAILDKDCRIGPGVKILNAKGVQHLDTPDYCIRDGIVVVPKGAVLREGTVI